MEFTLYTNSDMENKGSEEVQPKAIHGEGLLIIQASTGLVRTGVELINKPLTGRRRGDRSIPFETPKMVNGAREPLIRTVQGGLAEVFNDVDRTGGPVPLHEYLFHVSGNSYHNGIHTEIGVNSVTLGYSVMIYDGPDADIIPYNCLEVTDPLWTKPESLLEGDVRLLTRLVMADALNTGVYEQNMAQYHGLPHLRERAFTEPFSIRDVYREREEHEDIVK